MLVWEAKIRQMLEINPESFVLMMKIKLRQINTIICETLNLKMGLEMHSCKVRNLLHVLGGELELYCDIDISKQITEISKLLDEPESENKWDKLTAKYLNLYELILSFCG